MSYLKILRQVSSLVTPDRYLDKTSALEKKEEVTMGYVHNLKFDKRHVGSMKQSKMSPTLEAVCPGAPQRMAVQAEALAGEALTGTLCGGCQLSLSQFGAI